MPVIKNHLVKQRAAAQLVFSKCPIVTMRRSKRLVSEIACGTPSRQFLNMIQDAAEEFRKGFP